MAHRTRATTAVPVLPNRLADQAAPPSLTRQAAIRPKSLNAETRTIEVVWSTGADVKRMDWWTGAEYVERLSLKPGSVRLDRLNNGAPLLDAHIGYSNRAVIGVVESARIENGEGIATVRFAKNDEEANAIWNKVAQGIIRNVSVGYEVHAFQESREQKDGPVIRTATDWEPYEISAVPMGADDDAKFRGRPSAAAPAPTPPKERAAMNKPAPDQLRQVDPNEDGTCPEGYEKGDDGMCHLIEAGDEPDAERAATIQQERARAQGILAGCRAARLPQSVADKLIADGIPLSEARGKILETMNRGADLGPQPGPSRARVTGADPVENVWRGIGGALLHRINPQAFQLDDNARQYRTHSLLRTMEECLEQRGVRTRGMSNSQIVKMALEYRTGYHTTSDFANIFADVANKSLRAAYEAAPQTFTQISRRISVRDFKPINRVQLGEAPALEEVLEHGEFTTGTIAEGKEGYKLTTYGRIFGLTRQGLINDDLDAFGRLIIMFAQSARNKESDLVWSQILANGLMGDGVALFAAGHGNLAAVPAAISVDSLGDGRAAMRKQTGLDGQTYLNVMAKYLIVPPELETIADQFVTVITPQQGSNANPFAGRLSVISEPRLGGGVVLGGVTIDGSATAWYLAASIDQAIDLIEYAYLDGEEGPQVETRAGFEIDGVQTKCRLDFAAKVLDYRGLYKDPGA